MKMESVQDLMLTGMSYVLDFEQRIGKAAPDMAEAASNPELKEMFSKTATKSKEYASKIEAVYSKLGKEVDTNTNELAKAMITEVEHMVKNTEAGPVRDAALIVAANQQQAYRVASYGSLKTYAETIGKTDAVSGLEENLKDSKAGDEKFTNLAESTINKQAASVQAAA